MKTSNYNQALIIEELRKNMFTAGLNISNFLDWHLKAFQVSQAVSDFGDETLAEKHSEAINIAFQDLLSSTDTPDKNFRALGDFGISLAEILSNIEIYNSVTNAYVMTAGDLQLAKSAMRNATISYELNIPLSKSLRDEDLFRQNTMAKAISTVLDAGEFQNFTSLLTGCAITDELLAGIFLNPYAPMKACPECDAENSEKVEVCYSCSHKFVENLSGQLFAVISGSMSEEFSFLEPFDKDKELLFQTEFESLISEKSEFGILVEEANVFFKIMPHNFSRNVFREELKIFGYES